MHDAKHPPMSKNSRPEKLAERPAISFIEPPGPEEADIPEQKQHFELPVRFGAVPVDRAPLGWEIETRRAEVKVTKFQHAYPTIRLPFQQVQRVEFGHNAEFLATNEKDPKLRDLFPTGANRLFFGDNLHVMRQLPSSSIDLIYIDPPFFSGRNYNVIFGDKNEMRSFSDIWEGGMPGYLVWLNARLYEMKRLLKDTGSIFVHLDWHASHYVKVEMDKIFGYDKFRNEIIWHYGSGGRATRFFSRKHDVLLWYGKNEPHYFPEAIGVLKTKCPMCAQPMEKWNNLKKHVDDNGRVYRTIKSAGKIYKYYDDEPVAPPDVWVDVNHLQQKDPERIGYPTQKPENLLARVINAATEEGDVVADFFCGGGTTPAVAQRLNRRWIASDQSRIATAITADRITRVGEENATILIAPDFTVEHWGIYEAPRPLAAGQKLSWPRFMACAMASRYLSASRLAARASARTMWPGLPRRFMRSDAPITVSCWDGISGRTRARRRRFWQRERTSGLISCGSILCGWRRTSSASTSSTRTVTMARC